VGLVAGVENNRDSSEEDVVWPFLDVRVLVQLFQEGVLDAWFSEPFYRFFAVQMKEHATVGEPGY
jgi:hypothetical protein